MPKIKDMIRECILRPVKLDLPRKVYQYLLVRGAVERKPKGRGRPRKPQPV